MPVRPPPVPPPVPPVAPGGDSPAALRALERALEALARERGDVAACLQAARDDAPARGDGPIDLEAHRRHRADVRALTEAFESLAARYRALLRRYAGRVDPDESDVPDAPDGRGPAPVASAAGDAGART